RDFHVTGVQTCALPICLWAEHIIEVNPATDSIVWEWHVWNHLIQDFDPTKDNYGVISEHPELIDINGGLHSPDFIHLNAVAYNADLDQIVLSAHQFSELWIIDHSTSTAEAATGEGGNSNRGGDLLYRWGNPQKYGHGDESDRKFYLQHDPHWISDGPHAGKIMVFNNGRGRPCPAPCPGYSSVEIINPPLLENSTYDNSVLPYLPTGYDWRYVDPEDSLSFYSQFISGAQRLPNGNVLICSGANGNIFEINEEHEKVWEYQNPFTFDTPLSQGDEPLLPSGLVFRAYKYPSNYSGFNGVDLTPGNYLELNPDSSHCLPVITTMDHFTEFDDDDYQIFPNPASSEIHIQLNGKAVNRIIRIECWDSRGLLMRTIAPATQNNQLIVQNWPAGIYLIRIVHDHGYTVERCIKH